MDSQSALRFTNITASSGFSVQGESWGSVWGDANQDGLPDVYLSRHLGAGLLYINQGDGTFLDVTTQSFGRVTRGDKHGAAWADFDNDGDQDLLQLRGGEQTTQLFQNNGQGSFSEVAESRGLEYPASGRTPLWFDSNLDGRLDLVINTRNRDNVPPTIFEQGPNGFQDVGDQTGFTPNGQLNKFFSLLTDIGGSPNLDLLTKQASSSNGLEALELGQYPYRVLNLPTSLLNVSSIDDIVSGDFDGDLKSDLFLARSGRQGDVFQPNPNQLNAFLKVTDGQKSVRFKGNGPLTFNFPTLSPNEIFIGSDGENPETSQFNLSSTNLAVRGQPTYDAGSDRGLYLYYDRVNQEWTMSWSSPRGSDAIYAFVESQQEISSIETLGFRPERQFLTDQLFLRRNQTFVNATDSAGFILGQTAAVNAAAGDFDNDMDLDIYVVSTGTAGNRNNVIYENQGDGTFQVRLGTGSLGTSRGLGDTVTTVDYDQDGFLDVFLSNGNLFDGFGSISREYFNDAPFQLFRNQGNENAWLQLDLKGVNSNHDGIGSRVYVTAGGVTQLREQSNGIHSHAQNHKRIHFGLATSRRVALLKIDWTNGIQQSVRGIRASQVLTVKEGVGFAQRDIIIGTRAGERFYGFGGNDRLIGKGGNDSIRGGNGQDEIRGGSGRDVLVGGNGNDFIETGGGSDIVRFEAAREGGDTISDFTRNRDRIELVRAGFQSAIGAGALSANQFALGTTARTANHRIIYSRSTGNLWFDPDGVNEESQILLAQLANRTELSASDFIGI